MTPILTAFSIAAIAVIYAILADRDCRFAERKYRELEKERDADAKFGPHVALMQQSFVPLTKKQRDKMYDRIAARYGLPVLYAYTLVNPYVTPTGDFATWATLDSLIATREKP